MNRPTRNIVRCLATTLLATFVSVVSAANVNTTTQEGKVNITRTFQCGESNDNSTYQSGQVNINHTVQTCGTNTNQTGQFGDRNLNRTRQDQGVRQADNEPWNNGVGKTRSMARGKGRGPGSQ